MFTRLIDGVPLTDCAHTVAVKNASVERIFPLVFYFNAIKAEDDLKEKIIRSFASFDSKTIVSAAIHHLYVDYCAKLTTVNSHCEGERLKILNELIKKTKKIYANQDLSFLDGLLKKESPLDDTQYNFISALSCFLSTDNFENCVVKAASMENGDSAIGAIAGGLAGLYYTMRGIPNHLTKRLRDKGNLFNTVASFYSSITIQTRKASIHRNFGGKLKEMFSRSHILSHFSAIENVFKLGGDYSQDIYAELPKDKYFRRGGMSIYTVRNSNLSKVPNGYDMLFICGLDEERISMPAKQIYFISCFTDELSLKRFAEIIYLLFVENTATINGRLDIHDIRYFLGFKNITYTDKTKNIPSNAKCILGIFFCEDDNTLCCIQNRVLYMRKQMDLLTELVDADCEILFQHCTKRVTEGSGWSQWYFFYA